jgi:hypothetical protein
MNITVQVEPNGGAPAAVEYRWDTDTAILTANLQDAARAEGVSGSVEVAGNDGSWVILDVKGGNIHGVEVAVWPDVRKSASLRPPADVECARLVVPRRSAQAGVALLQMETPLVAEADPRESTIHFQLGGTRGARTVQIARDILVDVDEQQAIKGIWLLNVPPFPADE